VTTHANVTVEARRPAQECTDLGRRTPAGQPSAPVKGRDLRAAREDAGVGLGWLAARIGRSKGHLSKVEREIEDREVTPALVRDYERALGRMVGSHSVPRGSAQPPDASTQGGPHAATATDVMAAVTGPMAGVKETTLLRKMLVERHWQTPRTFRVQLLRAVKELADRESDPTLRMLDVSVRQFQRWLDGARPRPDTCRVLEYMFGTPVDRLLSPASTAPTVATSPAAQTLGDLPERAVLASPDTALGLAAVQVTVRGGSTVTVVCQDGEPARVAVVAGPVRLLIETPTDEARRLVAPAAVDVPSPSGGARIYSISERRAR